MSEPRGRGFSIEWYIALFASTSGRLGRESWWIGIALIAIMVVLINVLATLAAFSFFPSFKELNGTSILARFRFSGWLVLGIFLTVLYPLYALSVKRRRDRGGTGWDVTLYLAANGLFILIQAFGMEWPMTFAGIGYAMADEPSLPGLVLPMPTPAMQLAGAMLTVVTMLMVIPLGFLRGQAKRDGVKSNRSWVPTPGRGSIQKVAAQRWRTPAAFLAVSLVALGAGFAYSRYTSGEIVVGKALPGSIAGIVGTVLSGQQGKAGNLIVSPLATFANRFAQHCRSFEVDGDHPTAAVACRKDREWIVSFATTSQSARGRELELDAHLLSIGASPPFTVEGEALFF
ncbi:DUF805 domain-containing protein [Devosia beringensis]|uniref:DUF805 domain-containing protein n=1 Tax=Devosia beringensis TaxID=2657486 RepID=UPI00186B79C4|nr:DUF805 domain-containing protein [Devosia beringensis]